MSVVRDRDRASRLQWYHRPASCDNVVLRLHDPARAGCWVLLAGSELDAARAPRFYALLERSIRSGVRVVVLDLRETEFLSLRVAKLLGPAKADAWRHGVELRLLTGAHREVTRALDLAGVRPLFRHYDSIDAAAG